MSQLMIVTEDQASQKWCPQASCEIRKKDCLSVQHRCLGSHCMWWVWVDGEDKPQDRRAGCCGSMVR